MSPKVRNILIAVAVLLFLWFVWPTPYDYWHEQGTVFRRNRLLGTVEDQSDGRWYRR